MSISVVIPAYNAAKFLPDSVEGVARQILLPSELIIVNDGSTDDTVDVVNELIKLYSNLNIRLISQNNKGVSEARNKGIRHAKGDWIAFLDADDYWLASKLKSQFKVAENSSAKVGVIYCGFREVGENMSILYPKRVRMPKYSGNISRQLFWGNCVCGSCSAVLVRAEVFKEVGVFDENLHAAEDWDMWLRIGLKYHFEYVSALLVHIRRNRVSQQSNRKTLMIYDLTFIDKHVQNGLKWPRFCIMKWVARVKLAWWVPYFMEKCPHLKAHMSVPILGATPFVALIVSFRVYCYIYLEFLGIYRRCFKLFNYVRCFFWRKK